LCGEKTLGARGKLFSHFIRENFLGIRKKILVKKITVPYKLVPQVFDHRIQIDIAYVLENHH